MDKKVNLHDTMDAVIWTKEWLRTIKDHPEIPTDEGTMIGWFANAIMAGYDAASRTKESEPQCTVAPKDGMMRPNA